MKECIVLAGGLGTRLRSSIGDYPKCMAEVAGKPFLYYINLYIQSQGYTHVIYSLGYKHEIITNWLKTQNLSFTYDYVIEEEPLGTGGGIRLAMAKATTDDITALNGDTMFRVPLNDMQSFHTQNNSAVTIALKEMHDFDRYGVVNTNGNNQITSFEEKKPVKQGSINGGIYIVNKTAFLNKTQEGKFSFETDYLQAYVAEGNFYGFQSNEYFIDIGIPQDYNQVQTDFINLF
jgi:D-glycero-alpha-D-manno-heptose 1-phosphate guanylyltransferase